MPKHAKDFTRITSLQPTDLLYAIREADVLEMDKSVTVATLLGTAKPASTTVALPTTSDINEVEVTSYGSVFARLTGGAAGQNQILRFVTADIPEGAVVLIENSSLSLTAVNSVLPVNEVVYLEPGDLCLGVRTSAGLSLFRIQKESTRAANEALVDSKLDALDDYVETHTNYDTPDGWTISGSQLSLGITLPTAGTWIVHGHVMARYSSGTPGTYVALQCFWGVGSAPATTEDYALSGYASTTDIVHAEHVTVEMPVRRVVATGPTTLTLQHSAAFSGGPVARFVRLFAHKISA